MPTWFIVLLIVLLLGGTSLLFDLLYVILLIFLASALVGVLGVHIGGGTLLVVGIVLLLFL